LSDHIGRKPIMIGALILYFALTYPLFSWMYANPSFGSLITTQVALCSLLGVFFGPMSTALAEQFPAQVRSTGLGTAYNMAVMVFGGFAPFCRRARGAGILRDVRRGSRTSRRAVLEGTCSRRRFGGHGC
jgi:MFS family permease